MMKKNTDTCRAMLGFNSLESTSSGVEGGPEPQWQHVGGGLWGFVCCQLGESLGNKGAKGVGGPQPVGLEAPRAC